MLTLFLTIENESDKEFISGLYEQNYPIMKKKAYEITCDINVTDDIIHDAFVKLIDKIPILRSINCYKQTSYIVNTIKNTSIDHVRKRNTKADKQFMGEDNDIAELIVDTAMTVEEAYIIREDSENLGELMCKLSERDRDLLYNKYIFELSNKEISEVMDIPINNIRQYLVRARKRALNLLTSENGVNKSED
ncbi:MAG: sigma-70 family RNA polymerase sigma factor [Clostridiales bacterium]|jgi:RNA polymerase sigma-70 factor (ECF subfamily)|nr:sigma-70 family RNA polymerase sigma factor [Clostridiales bacterium]